MTVISHAHTFRNVAQQFFSDCAVDVSMQCENMWAREHFYSHYVSKLGKKGLDDDEKKKSAQMRLLLRKWISSVDFGFFSRI